MKSQCLTYFFVCDKMLPFVSSMHVDEQGTHQLTNFSHNQGKVTETDHSTVVLQINLKFPILKQQRIQEYNFRSTECQSHYKVLTTNTKNLSNCFENNNKFSQQIKKFDKNFKECIAQSFFKIRTKKRKFAETEVGQMLEKRKKLKTEYSTNPTNDTKRKLKEIENEISQETEQQFAKKVKESIGLLTGDDGGISTHGLWNAKNRIIPKDKSSIPTALKDNKGNFISSPEGIKELCLNEMVNRLRHRKIRSDLTNLHKIKEVLCEKKTLNCKEKKNP